MPLSQISANNSIFKHRFNMKEVKRVPKLRFSGFEKDWKSSLFADVATFTKGKNISKSDIVEDGETECIRYGELYTYYSEIINAIISKTNIPKENLVFSKSNDIIIPSSGETQLDIATASCVLKKNIALGGDLNIIRTKNNGIFIAYYLNNKKKKNIASLAQGNSVVHLYNHQLKTLSLNIPTLPEQQKIATFLSSVDKKIDQLQQKKILLAHYKKGVMQQLFTQKVRFTDEDGNNYPDWEKQELGRLGAFLGGGTPTTMNEKYWNGNIPWISSSDILENDIHTINISRYLSEEGIKDSATKKIPKNSIMIISRVGIGKLAVSKETLCTSQDFLNFKPIRDDSYFLAYYLIHTKNKFFALSQGTSIKGFTLKDLKCIRIEKPKSVEEQTKIANFLSAIDAKITLVDTQIENMRQFKQGLLQQMFV